MKPVARRWLHRVVVIVGASASIATPQKKWFLDAQVTAEAKDTARERILVVSASREPDLYAGPNGGSLISPMQPTTWPGTAKYLVPAGSPIGHFGIGKGCGGGCNECVPPRDGSEYVRIDRIERTSWTADSLGQATRTIGSSVKAPRALITVDATREPVLEVEPLAATPFRPRVIRLDWTPPTARFAIDWNDYGGGGRTAYVWSFHARITGPCSDAACATPPAEHVKITEVRDE